MNTITSKSESAFELQISDSHLTKLKDLAEVENKPASKFLEDFIDQSHGELLLVAESSV